MPGASLRNAVPQRTYRERAQPGSRKKLGLLEKHKDYSARARDHNAKKSRLRILRHKAADRNPDEFHFGMMRSNTQGGIKLSDRGSTSLKHQVVQLMKTQDAGYLRTIRQNITRERAKLEETIQIFKSGNEVESRPLNEGVNRGKTPQHTVFVEDETAQRDFDARDWSHTDDQGLKTKYNRPHRIVQDAVNQETSIEVPRIECSPSPVLNKGSLEWKQYQKSLKERTRVQQRRFVKLEVLKARESSLFEAEIALDRQRAQMSNNIGGIHGKDIRFKVRERKK